MQIPRTNCWRLSILCRSSFLMKINSPFFSILWLLVALHPVPRLYTLVINSELWIMHWCCIKERNKRTSPCSSGNKWEFKCELCALFVVSVAFIFCLLHESESVPTWGQSCEFVSVPLSVTVLYVSLYVIVGPCLSALFVCIFVCSLCMSVCCQNNILAVCTTWAFTSIWL